MTPPTLQLSTTLTTRAGRRAHTQLHAQDAPGQCVQGGGRGRKGRRSLVNRLVRFYYGTMVVAPWGNWRLAKEEAG